MMGSIDEDMADETGESSQIDDDASGNDTQAKTYLPKDLENEELVPDMSAYDMLHTFRCRCSCLSFDIIRDRLGPRSGYPVTIYAVAGTQAERGKKNSLVIMKISNLQKEKQEEKDDKDENDDESSEDSESDDGSESKEVIKTSEIYHNGAVNRVRICPQATETRVLVASWSEKGKVHIWNIAPQLSGLEREDSSKDIPKIKPYYTFGGHVEEGYALDWSSTRQGYLLTGDCTRHIHLWTPRESDWLVSQSTFSSHSSSVEDLQWSPTEEHVFASCSTDKTIRVWDDRAQSHKANMITVADAHTADVNVINWNRMEPFICSGGDDGIIKIWDLRQLKSPAALFKHHIGAITSVEWHPTDSGVFGASGEDNQISLWDLSVESTEPLLIEDQQVPPQLLFIHQGQKEIKELHWHPHVNGLLMSTSLDSFNIFKTISV